MKTAYILFFLAFLIVVTSPFAAMKWQRDELHKLGKEHPFVRQRLDNLRDTVVANGPNVEKEIALGFVRSIHVNGGIQLVHDAAMNQSVRLLGPSEAVEAFTAEYTEGRYRLGFSKPVQLSRPLEVHLDFNRHAMHRLDLSFHVEGGRRVFPALVTRTPLTVPHLNISGCYVIDDLLVEADFLHFANFGCSGPTEVIPRIGASHGTVRHFMGAHHGQPFLRAPGVHLHKAELYADAPQGQRTSVTADTVLARYTFDNLPTRWEGVPDTLVVTPATVVKVLNNHDEVPGMADQLVYVIRKR